MRSAATASAQSYPAKPVRVINPYQAGGGLDMRCRTIAERLSECRRRHRHRVTWSVPFPEMNGRMLADIAREWQCMQTEACGKLQPGGAIYFQMPRTTCRGCCNSRRR